MRNNVHLVFLLFMVLLCGITHAQAPQRFTYQAVVRNAGGQLITNHSIGVRISIVQGSATGNAVYVENHSATTNSNGLFTISIGTGNATIGSFSSVDWSIGTYYVKSEIDPEGGTDYTLVATQQLISVPYALYATTAEQLKTPFSESQVISISNDTIFLTGGSFVILPHGFSGNYYDLTGLPDWSDSIATFLNGIHIYDTLHSYHQDTVVHHVYDTMHYYYYDTVYTLSYDTLTQYHFDTVFNYSYDTTYTHVYDTIDRIFRDTIINHTYDTIYTHVYDTVNRYYLDTVFNQTYNFDTVYNRSYDTTYTHVYDTIDRIFMDTVINRTYDTIFTHVYDTVNRYYLDTVFNRTYNYDTIYSHSYDTTYTHVFDTIDRLFRDTIINRTYDTIYTHVYDTVNRYYMDTVFNRTYNYDTVYSHSYDTTYIHVYDTIDRLFRDTIINRTYDTTYTHIYDTIDRFFRDTVFNRTYDTVFTFIATAVDTHYVDSVVANAGYLTSFTESQILSISHDTIFLTGGSFVKLPAGFSGDYNDLTNKPTLFSGNYNDLSNKPTIPTVPTNVSAFTNDAGYLTSFTESQILSISHDTVFLTGGSFVKLPAGFSGNYNDLSNKPTIPTVPTNVSAFANDAGYLTSFTESQILSISHDTVFLTGGSFVKLPAGFSGDYNDLTNKPTLFSGDYNDLTNKPTLFSGDYNDLSNKPTIPTIPTNVSSFTNDAGYITTYTETQTLADVASLGNSVNAQIKNLSNPTDAQDAVNLQSMQDALQDLVHRYDSIIAYQQRIIDTLSRVTNIAGEPFDSIGASYAVFSVSPTKKVRFSKGNLQYIDTGYHAVITGGTASGTWRFANNQLDTINVQGARRDCFIWATSGWNHGYSNPYLPTANSAYTVYNPTQLNGAYANSDWGVYNAISNGGNLPNMWRTLSQEEWNYLLNTRSVSFARYSLCKVDNIYAIIIFPDNYIHPALQVPWPTITTSTFPNLYSAYHFALLEKAGCVFLPIIGWSGGNIILPIYWTSDLSHKIVFNTNGSPWIRVVSGSSTSKYRIRLVRDVEN